MKLTMTRYLLIVSFICSTLLFGCALGPTDSRFLGVPSQEIEVDGLPVSVKVIQVDQATFDVEVFDGRTMGFSGLNPLILYSRLRTGAEIVLRENIGNKAVLELVDEQRPAGTTGTYLRYKMTTQ